MVPKGWKRIPLKQVADVRSGVAKGKSGLKNPVSIPYLRVANVQDGHINLDDVKEIEIEESKIERYALKKGDVLMNEGGDYDKLGRGDVWQGQIEPCLHQNHVFAVRPDPTVIDSFFLAALAASNYGKTYFLSCAKRSTNLASINSTQIKEFPILVPPIDEQNKIAQILSTWDKAISTTEQLLANSQQQKNALMQQLLTGKKRLLDKNGVRFSGKWKTSITPYKQLPNDWSEIGLSRISSFITKGSTPTTYGYEWQDNGIPFIRSECVGENGFKESGLAFIGDDAHKTMSRSQVFSGDILITITGNVGRVCKLPESIPEANINQHIAKITLDRNVVCPDFVFHCLQDRKYRIHFERITTGQAYPQISLVQVRDAVIPMPTLYEQQKIAAVLSNADQEIISLQKKLYALKQEKKALMQQLLTGKRRVLVS